MGCCTQGPEGQTLSEMTVVVPKGGAMGGYPHTRGSALCWGQMGSAPSGGQQGSGSGYSSTSFPRLISANFLNLGPRVSKKLSSKSSPMKLQQPTEPAGEPTPSIS